MRSAIEVGAGVPAFLGKLWRLVEDTDTDHLISWHTEGKTFCIHNQAEFAKELLPLYYKHNNMASFIRQLNMYGFHKVSSVENGGLRADKDDIEFYHPCFLMGRPYLLEHIKRKISNPKVPAAGEDKALLKPELMNKVLSDVKNMKGRQENLDARFSVMKHENEALWREVALLRQKHIKQQQIVNNLIQFLMSLVQPSRNGPLKTGVKRRYQLMIDAAAHNSNDKNTAKTSRVHDLSSYEHEDFEMEDENGPTIHEVAEVENTTDFLKKKRSLLLTDDENQASPSHSNPSPRLTESPLCQESIPNDDVDSLLDNSDVFRSVSPSRIDTRTPDISIEDMAQQNPNDQPSNSQYSFVAPSQLSNSLPANIFDDDGNSQEEILSDEDVLAVLQNDANENAKLLNKLKSKTASNGKSTSKNGGSSDKFILQPNIKQELILDDDNDLNQLTLATVPTGKDGSRPSLERFTSVEEVDDHLDSMQTDLESLKEILRNDSYSLDANTLFGIFAQDDPFYNLAMNTTEAMLDKSKTADESDPASQVISYVPQPTLDFGDFDLDDDERNWDDTSANPSALGNVDSSLNTPQVQMNAPDFSAK